MNPDKQTFLPLASLALFVGLTLAGPSRLMADAQTLHYQGRLTVGSTAHHGSADFKFALWNPDSAKMIWSNDGTTGSGPPVAAVTLNVDNGLFSVSLGSAPMTPVPSDIFDDDTLVLRIWADSGSGMVLLTPDQKVEPVAVAHHAETVAAGSVDTTELALSAVSSSRLANFAVTTDKLAPLSVTGVKLASNAVTNSKLATGAVTGSKIAGATITGSNIAISTITGSNIATGSILGSDISNNAITGTHISNGTITGSDIAGSSIMGSHIASGAITNSDISSSANIASSKINDGTGSGLDADLLDGLDSGQLLRADTSDTFTGARLTVNNDLRIGDFSTLSFDGGASQMGGFLGGISLNAPGDIILTAGDELSIPSDVRLDGSTLTVDSTNNAVGLGTTSPESRLHVRDPDFEDTAIMERSGQTTDEVHTSLRVRSSKSSAYGSGFGTGINFEIDNTASATPPLTTAKIEANFSESLFGPPIGADVGVIRFFTYHETATDNLATVASLSPSRLNIGNAAFEGGSIDVGDGVIGAGRVDLNADTSSFVARLRRDGDGDLVTFLEGNSTVGSISLSGTTVSYNAFTGSHYAQTPDLIDEGLLVTMTGENRFSDGDRSGEPHYGIAVCSEENSQAIIGAYGGRPRKPADEGAEESSLDHPHLVNSVGNAHIWIADTGVDIKPGDYLISSSVPGHAQLDSRSALESHIIGRAAEAIVWKNVTSKTPGGVRHAKITVLFDSFARYNPPELRKQLANRP